MLRVYLLIFLCSWPLALSAQVYKHVDKDGKVTYTDQPPPDAKPIELKPLNTTPPPVKINYPAPPKKPAAAGGTPEVSITSPANETVIPNGPGNFSVAAKVIPSLAAGTRLQLLIDGAAYGEPQLAAFWALTNIYRGSHNLAVIVVDEKNKELARSEAVVVYVFRPSRKN